MSKQKQLLKRINAVPVSTQDILDMVTACDDYRREHPGHQEDGMGGMFIVAQHAGSPDRAFALWSRMNALAKLVTEHGAHGWTFPNGKEDGGLFAQEAVFAATAVHPLIEEGNQWVFDHQSFLDRVLELAEVDARG